MLVVRNHPFTEGKREGTNFQIFVKKGRFSKFFCVEGGVNQKRWSFKKRYFVFQFTYLLIQSSYKRCSCNNFICLCNVIFKHSVHSYTIFAAAKNISSPQHGWAQYLHKEKTFFRLVISIDFKVTHLIE